MVSGLDGFEEAVKQAQTQTAFVCVSDIADGYTELDNTPRTRRIKTVFFAMRHAVEDMAARVECMETMRELFRQFMSRLLPEKVRLEQNCIYLDGLRTNGSITSIEDDKPFPLTTLSVGKYTDFSIVHTIVFKCAYPLKIL